MFFKKYFTYLFLEREGTERNIDQLPLSCPHLGTWPAAQACALTKNHTGDLAVHRVILNPLSNTSQGSDFSCWEIRSGRKGSLFPMLQVA